MSLRTGKLKNHPFDYCTLQVEAGVEEFHLAVREPLDRVEAAIHLAGQP